MQQAHKDILAKNKVTAFTSTPKKKKPMQGFSHSPQSPFLGHGSFTQCTLFLQVSAM